MIVDPIMLFCIAFGCFGLGYISAYKQSKKPRKQPKDLYYGR